MNNYKTLTLKECDIIQMIATDIQSGRHLLREEKGWEGMPFTKEEHTKMWNEIRLSIRKFSWFESTDFSPRRNLEILVCFKSTSNFEFNNIIDYTC